MAAAASIKFTVHRRPAVLVAPASPTPRELKRLSDIDDQDSLRIQIPIIYFYKRMDYSMAMDDDDGKDPVVVIRDAIARALVPYYPFAGRLREHDGGKLAVDCTAEGVLFVEADADVRLEDFGDNLLPPFPCLEELLFDVPGSSDILDTPLLLIQVTRLACRGFVMAVRLNHTMADGVGVTQFLAAVAELARGGDAQAQAPTTTVPPVWERHLLEAPHNSPPRRDELAVYYYDDDDDEEVVRDDTSSNNMLLLLSPADDMALRHLFFGPGEIAAIRAQLSPELQNRASRFDVIAGWLWKHRTMALAPDDSNEPMLLIISVDARGRCSRAAIPAGYYGNAIAMPVAASTAGELCNNPIGYAVALVKEAKDKVDMEYMRSAADVVVHRRRRGRVPRIPAGVYALTDETKVRWDDFDLGWGRPVYAGPAQPVSVPALPWVASFVLPLKNANGDGEDGAVVPVCLPRAAMDRLVDEMGKLRRWRSPADAAATMKHSRHGFHAVVKRSAL